MRYVFLAIAAFILFFYLINKDLPGSFTGMNMLGTVLNKTGISNRIKENDKKTDELFRQLEDQKDNLAFLHQQVSNLQEGLRETPDIDRNGYFKDLLTAYQEKERTLNDQLAAKEQAYQESFQQPPIQSPAQIQESIERNREFAHQRAEAMQEAMEELQSRIEDQMDRINDIMEENHASMEAQADRLNEIMEQNQQSRQDYPHRD